MRVKIGLFTRKNARKDDFTPYILKSLKEKILKFPSLRLWKKVCGGTAPDSRSRDNNVE